jgi:hypothetical protein
MALNFDVKSEIRVLYCVLLFCFQNVTMRITMCCFRIEIENQESTRIFEFDAARK